NLLVYLVLPGGGQGEFKATAHPSGSQVYYTYRAQAIIDPFLRRTSFTYTNGLLTQVTEPAGRYIQISYAFQPPNDYQVQEYLVDQITASDGRSVQYSYSLVGPLGLRTTALTSITYFGNPNIKATYTYQTPNDGSNLQPLLSTCDDPMYLGPMKGIGYNYATGSPGGLAAALGQLDSEMSSTGTIVSQLGV